MTTVARLSQSGRDGPADICSFPNNSKDPWSISLEDVSNSLDVSGLIPAVISCNVADHQDDVQSVVVDAHKLGFADPIEMEHVAGKKWQIEITNETENNILYLIFDEDLNSFFPNLENWECTIKLSQNFDTYSFLSDSKKGDIIFKCDIDLTFDRFEFYTTTGDIEVELNHTVMNSDMYFESTEGDIELIMDLMLITGNIFCETKSGFILPDFWNIKFLKNSSIDCLITVGNYAEYIGR